MGICGNQYYCLACKQVTGRFFLPDFIWGNSGHSNHANILAIANAGCKGCRGYNRKDITAIIIALVFYRWRNYKTGLACSTWISPVQRFCYGLTNCMILK